MRTVGHTIVLGCHSKSSMMTSSNGNISALLAICAGNSPVTDEFHTQRPVTRNFDVFLDPLLNQRWVNSGEAGDLRPMAPILTSLLWSEKRWCETESTQDNLQFIISYSGYQYSYMVTSRYENDFRITASFVRRMWTFNESFVIRVNTPLSKQSYDL